MEFCARGSYVFFALRYFFVLFFVMAFWYGPVEQGEVQMHVLLRVIGLVML